MATLGPELPKFTYTYLLQVPGGVTSALTVVQGGDGTALPLQVSTAGVNFTGQVRLGGTLLSAAGIALVTAVSPYAQLGFPPYTLSEVGKVLGVTDVGGVPTLAWVDGAAAYSPALDFSDALNSQYLGAF